MLDKLRAIQARERLTDQQMADHLHIARSTWTDLRNGRLPLSHRVQMLAAGAFPELLADLLGAVSGARTGAVAP